MRRTGEVRARAARSPHSSEHALVTMAMAMTTAANPGEGGDLGNQKHCEPLCGAEGPPVPKP